MPDPDLVLTWLLAAQAKGGLTESLPLKWIIGFCVLFVLIFYGVSYSGSKVRTAVAEPWKSLADNMNTDLNLGFLFQGPVMSGSYRGYKVRALSSGNLVLRTYKTILEVGLTQPVNYQVYLMGHFVSDGLGTLMGLEDLSREIPDFTGQLLYQGISERGAMSVASPQVMQVLQSHPKGALKISGDVIQFESGSILNDPAQMIDLFRWLIEMSKYVGQLS